QAPIVAGRQAPVAAERDGGCMEVVSGQAVKEFVVLPVPDLYHPVGWKVRAPHCRREVSAIGPERNGICRTEQASGGDIVAKHLLACRKVPDPYLPVRAAGG